MIRYILQSESLFEIQTNQNRKKNIYNKNTVYQEKFVVIDYFSRSSRLCFLLKQAFSTEDTRQKLQ